MRGRRGTGSRRTERRREWHSSLHGSLACLWPRSTNGASANGRQTRVSDAPSSNGGGKGGNLPSLQTDEARLHRPFLFCATPFANATADAGSIATGGRSSQAMSPWSAVLCQALLAPATHLPAT